jgi:hypothetical protein
VNVEDTMPMVEDLRGGSNLISRDGRGPLSLGARRALERQHAIQREVAGVTPGEFEARNLERIAVDRALKAPRVVVGEPKTGSPADMTRPPDPRSGR